MALTVVQQGILGMFDRLAYVVGSRRASGTEGLDLRTRWGDVADDESDILYCNRILGQKCTDVDVELAAANIGNLATVKAFIAAHNDYARLDLGLTGFNALLAAARLRLDAKSGSIFTAAGITLSAANLAGDADAGAAAPGASLGSLLRGGAITGAADISATSAPSPIVIRVKAIGTADWTVTLTPKREPITTQTINQIILGTSNGGQVGDVYCLGQQLVNGTPAAGQPVVPVAATGQFKTGEVVLITEHTGAAPDEVWTRQEWGVIDTIAANTSLTLTQNLLHSYTGAALVRPCFRGLIAATGSGGTASDEAWFGVQAERRLKG